MFGECVCGAHTTKATGLLFLVMSSILFFPILFFAILFTLKPVTPSKGKPVFLSKGAIAEMTMLQHCLFFPYRVRCA